MKNTAAIPQPTPESLLRSAHGHFRQGDGAAALGLLKQLLAIDDRNIKAHQLATRVATDIGDIACAEEAFSSLIALDPENPRWVSGKQRFLSQLGANDEAVSLIRTALDRGLGGFDLFKQVHLLKLPADLANEVLQWARSVDADAPVKERIAAANILLSYGHPLPPHLSQRPSQDDKATQNLSFYDWLENAPPDSALKRAPLVEKEHDAIMLAPAENPAAVAIVFTGLADRLTVPLAVFDRYLAALNVTAVYLRDSSRLLYNNGVASIAPNYAETVSYLRDLLSRLGTPRLVTIGSSAGGYAAIRYGLALGAESIVGFSAPTNLTASFAADDGRARAVALRLNKMLPAEALEVRPLIAAAGGKTTIHLVYGENMPQDVMHALYLENAPGVKLHPLPGVDSHASLTVLAQEKKLLSFMADTVLRPEA